MTLRRTLTGLALCVMALTLFMGCVETGPPPPMVVMETPPPPPPEAHTLFCERFQPGPPGRPHHRRAPDRHPAV